MFQLSDYRLKYIKKITYYIIYKQELRIYSIYTFYNLYKNIIFETTLKINYVLGETDHLVDGIHNII